MKLLQVMQKYIVTKPDNYQLNGILAFFYLFGWLKALGATSQLFLFRICLKQMLDIVQL